jgi:hypothetical protein
MRLPNPTEVGRVGPLPVSGKVFCPPNVIVVILVVVTKSLREVAFAIVQPIIIRIPRNGGEKIPVANVLTLHDQFRRAAVA